MSLSSHAGRADDAAPDLRPLALPGEFAVATVDPATAATLRPRAMVRDGERVTIVLPLEIARASGVRPDYTVAWIRLHEQERVPQGSASGFAIVAALARAGIGCLLAGVGSGHLLVPSAQRDAALAVLRGLAADAAAEA
ncbi:MAG: hypothetical protein Q4E05_05490 [Pseudoclavibacter sp.]|nr:hypothetical protein [Pseudoclavibacter sp.]